MRIEVNVEKFKNDKEYYNRKYCNYILESWERYHAAMVKKLQKLKRQSQMFMNNGEIMQRKIQQK